MSLDLIKSKIWETIQEKALDTAIVQGESLHLKGLSGSLKTIFMYLILECLNVPILAVFTDREEAEWVSEELDSLLGEGSVGFFPSGEGEDTEIALLNPRKTGMQMEVLRGIHFKRLKAVVTTPGGILLKIPTTQNLSKAMIRLAKGEEQDLYRLVEKLVEFGYSRESVVEAPGEISLRGGILDIFPYTGELPHRIEFFGDTIESIRTFDIASQLSTGKSNELILVPALGSGNEHTASLFHYLPTNRLVFIEDPELVLAEAEKERQREKKGIWDPESLESFINQSPALFHHTLSGPKETVDFGGRMVTKLGLHITEIRAKLVSFSEKHQDVWIVCENENQKGRLSDLLQLIEEPIENVGIVLGPIKRGFALPNIQTLVFTEGDLFGKVFRRRRRERFKEGFPIRELSSLNPGDFIVHVDYGIGKYLGLEKIKVRDVERECLALLYQNSDKLYVPVDKMERVQKYRGREGVTPVLSKLGGVQWEKLKSRTKHSIKVIAKELIALYSARHALPGYAFPPDTSWQKELEASFVYEETPDQAKAIEEVRVDMENPRPMERLVCGDVGYGKTEVAIRAAFKCVSDGKQVVVLVPTTILAQQHFRTFSERLSQFPVVIEMLSRFRSPKEQKTIVEKIKRGEIDILIGTHRILSKDVGFKNLGLLVIDEEQRFGVKHKERLKAYRKTVDVLTLSATPIPRTLYFSLMGIRDMSLINTPPKDRRPIVTEVLPFSKEVIEDAIRRELARNGQVFFVHNRIKSIYAMAIMIQKLVPGIRLALAHGQMNEHELEKVMLDFDAGKYDCLVSTTIIESGLDLPNVNTLLINRADHMGLAQLYQLRGRVGRSDHQAYAYLFTPPFPLLNEEAIKRLRTIEEFTELGSGFQIAQRDLEIRGAGNLLGVQQSGNMDELGYDLYIKLVEEAVQEIKHEEEEGVQEKGLLEIECQVEVGMDAYLPETYVEDESLRVNLYRRLALVREPIEVEHFERELKDRFGALPKEAIHLLEGAHLRIIGQKSGFKKIIIEDGRMKLFFNEQWAHRFPTPEQFSKQLRVMLNSFSVPVRFLQKGGFGMSVILSGENTLAEAKKVLQSLG
jgi:transcription-repair coupling factor (superfamily II helicase)